MQQVTEDLESNLHRLESIRSTLVKRRDSLIREAERMIVQANADFDETAIPLGRKINELRERLQRQDNESERQEQRRGRNAHKPPMLDGLNEDEQTHYMELLARRKKR